MIVLGPNEPGWTAFLATHPDASPFHHPSWQHLLADCYGYRSFVLAETDRFERVQCGLPVIELCRPFSGKRWISLPFTDYCPMLSVSGSAPGIVDELAGMVADGRLQRFELRAGLTDLPHTYTHAVAVRHTLALSADAGAVRRTFSKMHQRNIRKAEEAGVMIRRGTQDADIAEFYRLHVSTRRRLGVPVQPRRFFRELRKHVLESGLGFVLSAEVERRVVASAVFLAWNGTVVYKYGASDARFWKYRANNLLFWTAIRWACENGYRLFDFGRSDIEDNGLREFKNGWGTVEEPLKYTVIAKAPPAHGSPRLEKALATVIRRSPEAVCQIVGECLYKYSA